MEQGFLEAVEIYLNINKNTFNATFSGSISSTKKTINEETFYPNYHQLAKIYLFVEKKVKQNWSLSILWAITSGRPANFFSSRVYFIKSPNGKPNEFEMSIPKNYFWYPLFHRLDIKLKQMISFKNINGSINFNILNLYNRNNVLFYKSFKSEYNWDDHSYDFQLISQRGIPFLPTLSLELNF